MIIANLRDAARYEALHPLLHKLFEYVATHDLSHVPAGRIELEGDDLFINVADSALRTREEQRLEVHRRYLDVHFPLSGPETIGWRALSTLDVQPDAPFDEAADFALYTAPAEAYATLQPGSFCIVWPEDAHAPIIGQGTLRKLIAKVKLKQSL